MMVEVTWGRGVGQSERRSNGRTGEGCRTAPCRHVEQGFSVAISEANLDHNATATGV